MASSSFRKAASENFVGGCSLQAGETVCAARDDSDGTGQILDEMASLIDKSLLQQIEQEEDEPRLVMLETLAASGEAEVTRLRTDRPYSYYGSVIRKLPLCPLFGYISALHLL